MSVYDLSLLTFEITTRFEFTTKCQFTVLSSLKFDHNFLPQNINLRGSEIRVEFSNLSLLTQDFEFTVTEFTDLSLLTQSLQI